jgi:hypothetical protein
VRLSGERLCRAGAGDRGDAAYRDQSDPLARFLRLCTVRDPAAKVKSSELLAVHEAWAKREGGACGGQGLLQRDVRQGLREDAQRRHAMGRAEAGRRDHVHTITDDDKEKLIAHLPDSLFDEEEGDAAAAAAGGPRAPGFGGG